ncbi:MAG TPA: hypothetical protein DD435_10095 [Cyanobacteria bacterium UBA8530]|nr:hypothetical protein [Cyanobacteria bacterium UBA8530]
MIPLRRSAATIAVFLLWGASPAASAPREVRGVYEIDLSGMSSKKSSRLWLPEFKEWNEQTVQRVSYEPKPDKIIKDPVNENRIAYWAAPPDKIKVSFWATLFRSEVRLDSVNLAPYQKDGPLYRNYTRPEGFVDGAIRSKSRAAIGKERNPLRKVRSIALWLKNHPPFSERKFVGMCRAAGVPARLVSGFSLQPGREKKFLWPEYYLPRYGWLPFLEKNKDPWRVVEDLLVLSKGSNISLFSDPSEKKPQLIASLLDGGIFGKESLPREAWRIKAFPPFDPRETFLSDPFHLKVPVPFGWTLVRRNDPNFVFSARLESGGEEIGIFGKRYENPGGLGIKEVAEGEVRGIPGYRLLAGQHLYLSDLTGFRLRLEDSSGKPEVRIYFWKGDRLFFFTYRSSDVFDREARVLEGCVGSMEVR